MPDSDNIIPTPSQARARLGGAITAGYDPAEISARRADLLDAKARKLDEQAEALRADAAGIRETVARYPVTPAEQDVIRPLLPPVANQ